MTDTTTDAATEPIETDVPPTDSPATDSEPTDGPASDGPAPDSESSRNRRKVREGTVTSVSMTKTVVVSVTERVRHRRYGKTVQRTKKLHVHDENEEARLGDRVRVAETRPLSRTKHWRLLDVVERAR